MIRAVLDTNTLASGAVASVGAPAQIIDAWLEGAFEVIISAYIFEELARTLAKPYFVRRLTPGAASAFLDLVRSLAAPIAITTPVSGVAPDPADDEVLGTALSGSAEYLVTGDRKLRELGAYQGVQIVSPREFLEILAAG